MKKFFFKGTYGLDKFSKLLLVIGVLFLINSKSILFGIIIIGYAIWRSLSHNIEGRKRELMTFESYIKNLNYKLKKIKLKGIFGNSAQGIRTSFNKMKDKKHHVVVSCPKCSQKLRLPKKKGAIIVTCTKCSTEFKIKT